MNGCTVSFTPCFFVVSKWFIFFNNIIQRQYEWYLPISACSGQWVGSPRDTGRTNPVARRDFPWARRTKPRPTPGRAWKWAHPQTVVTEVTPRKQNINNVAKYTIFTSTLTPGWRISNIYTVYVLIPTFRQTQINPYFPVNGLSTISSFNTSLRSTMVSHSGTWTSPSATFLP
jgi:hypothetical protein